MKPTILLAEDDRNDVFLFKHALKRSGVDVLVEVVPSGEEAIERLAVHGKVAEHDRSARLVAVFLDLKLPRGNGFEVLEWLSRQTSYAGLPVIVLSASEEPSDVARAREFGTKAYLVKPPTAEQLAQLLGDLTAVRDE